MSYWTYIKGTVEVSPMGRTQEEKEYILKTVLNHLPIVTGSEDDMHIHIIQKAGDNGSSSCDEFGDMTNNLTNSYGQKSRKHGWLRTQDEYILVVEASLRDRMFEETYREFIKWLCRLAKRVDVYDVLVNIKGYSIKDGKRKDIILRDEDINNHSFETKFGQMFEKPSWSQDCEIPEPNWCEYLMWDRGKDSSYPLILGYKYFNDEENDKEAEHRLKYWRT